MLYMVLATKDNYKFLYTNRISDLLKWLKIV